MKIADVDVVVTCPDGCNYVLLKITTDEGIHGWGEGSLIGSNKAVVELLEQFRPMLLGRDADQIEDTWHFLYQSTYWRDGPVQKAAIAAVDIALWDIKAKRAGMPLYQLLGGRARRGVRVYGHAAGRDLAELEDSVRSFLARGYQVIRAQLGPYGGPGVLGYQPSGRRGVPGYQVFEPTPMVVVAAPRLFEHLRSVFGDTVEFLLDLHEQLSPIEAARVARALEPYAASRMGTPTRRSAPGTAWTSTSGRRPATRFAAPICRRSGARTARSTATSAGRGRRPA